MAPKLPACEEGQEEEEAEEEEEEEEEVGRLDETEPPCELGGSEERWC